MMMKHHLLEENLLLEVDQNANEVRNRLYSSLIVFFATRQVEFTLKEQGLTVQRALLHLKEMVGRMS